MKKRTSKRQRPLSLNGVAHKRTPFYSSAHALAERRKLLSDRVLNDARVYLSGPMDFVASRVEEKRNGWRSRVGQFLRRLGAKVYDPWNKPTVVGLPEYGKEDEFTTAARDKWTFEDNKAGDKTRAQLSDGFWPTLHIDLRMVDITDFTIAYCPTNVYSVGTVHEIVMATLQKKPVLLVSPPISFPALDELRAHFAAKQDEDGAKLLDDLIRQSSLHVNERGIPSLWYMAMLDAHYFFDGFGFAKYFKEFPSWKYNALDEREEKYPPKRPLLPYLEKLNHQLPLRYDLKLNKYVDNPDWLILNSKETE